MAECKFKTALADLGYILGMVALFGAIVAI